MYIGIVMLTSIIVGYVVGRNYRVLEDSITELYKREPEAPAEAVTTLPPEQVVYRSDSAVVIPKSPDEIDRQEQLEIARKIREQDE